MISSFLEKDWGGGGGGGLASAFEKVDVRREK